MPAVLRCIFMGTPEFALGPLEALLDAPHVDVALVVTRPDAVSGRGKTLVPSPVKALALQRGVPVLETKSLRGAEVQEQLRAVGADVFCVAAYGAILPAEVLAMPRLGCLNVHASLLPAGRGAAPMQRGLLEGDERLGFSIMRMEEGLDTGPFCAQGSVEVAGRNYDEVSAELSRLGGASLAEVLARFAAGEEIAWTVQDDSRATYAAKLDKAEVMPAPILGAAANMHRVQASSDAAPARCRIAGRGVRLVRVREVAGQGGALPAPGAVLAPKGRILLGCTEGTLEVLELRPDGKRTMTAAEFAPGLHGDSLTWEAL